MSKALITGPSRGIGATSAKGLACRRYGQVLLACPTEKLRALAAAF